MITSLLGRGFLPCLDRRWKCGPPGCSPPSDWDTERCLRLGYGVDNLGICGTRTERNQLKTVDSPRQLSATLLAAKMNLDLPLFEGRPREKPEMLARKVANQLKHRPAVWYVTAVVYLIIVWINILLAFITKFITLIVELSC